MAAYGYDFKWDSRKARANLTKHGVEFERATEVFLDPLAMTISDEEHSEEINGSAARIRIISARRPTKSEVRAYDAQP